MYTGGVSNAPLIISTDEQAYPLKQEESPLSNLETEISHSLEKNPEKKEVFRLLKEEGIIDNCGKVKEAFEKWQLPAIPAAKLLGLVKKISLFNPLIGTLQNVLTQLNMFLENTLSGEILLAILTSQEYMSLVMSKLLKKQHAVSLSCYQPICDSQSAKGVLKSTICLTMTPDYQKMIMEKQMTQMPDPTVHDLKTIIENWDPNNGSIIKKAQVVDTGFDLYRELSLHDHSLAWVWECTLLKQDSFAPYGFYLSIHSLEPEGLELKHCHSSPLQALLDLYFGIIRHCSNWETLHFFHMRNFIIEDKSLPSSLKAAIPFTLEQLEQESQDPEIIKDKQKILATKTQFLAKKMSLESPSWTLGSDAHFIYLFNGCADLRLEHSTIKVKFPSVKNPLLMNVAIIIEKGSFELAIDCLEVVACCFNGKQEEILLPVLLPKGNPVFYLKWKAHDSSSIEKNLKKHDKIIQTHPEILTALFSLLLNNEKIEKPISLELFTSLVEFLSFSNSYRRTKEAALRRQALQRFPTLFQSGHPQIRKRIDQELKESLFLKPPTFSPKAPFNEQWAGFLLSDVVQSEEDIFLVLEIVNSKEFFPLRDYLLKVFSKYPLSVSRLIHIFESQRTSLDCFDFLLKILEDSLKLSDIKFSNVLKFVLPKFKEYSQKKELSTTFHKSPKLIELAQRVFAKNTLEGLEFINDLHLKEKLPKNQVTLLDALQELSNLQKDVQQPDFNTKNSERRLEVFNRLVPALNRIKEYKDFSKILKTWIPFLQEMMNKGVSVFSPSSLNVKQAWQELNGKILPLLDLQTRFSWLQGLKNQELTVAFSEESVPLIWDVMFAKLPTKDMCFSTLVWVIQQGVHNGCRPKVTSRLTELLRKTPQLPKQFAASMATKEIKAFEGVKENNVAVTSEQFLVLLEFIALSRKEKNSSNKEALFQLYASLNLQLNGYLRALLQQTLTAYCGKTVPVLAKSLPSFIEEWSTFLLQNDAESLVIEFFEGKVVCRESQAILQAIQPVIQEKWSLFLPFLEKWAPSFTKVSKETFEKVYKKATELDLKKEKSFSGGLESYLKVKKQCPKDSNLLCTFCVEQLSKWVLLSPSEKKASTKEVIFFLEEYGSLLMVLKEKETKKQLPLFMPTLLKLFAEEEKVFSQIKETSRWDWEFHFVPLFLHCQDSDQRYLFIEGMQRNDLRIKMSSEIAEWIMESMPTIEPDNDDGEKLSEILHWLVKQHIGNHLSSHKDLIDQLFIVLNMCENPSIKGQMFDDLLSLNLSKDQSIAIVPTLIELVEMGEIPLQRRICWLRQGLEKLYPAEIIQKSSQISAVLISDLCKPDETNSKESIDLFIQLLEQFPAFTIGNVFNELYIFTTVVREKSPSSFLRFWQRIEGLVKSIRDPVAQQAFIEQKILYAVNNGPQEVLEVIENDLDLFVKNHSNISFVVFREIAFCLLRPENRMQSAFSEACKSFRNKFNLFRTAFLKENQIHSLLGEFSTMQMGKEIKGTGEFIFTSEQCLFTHTISVHSLKKDLETIIKTKSKKLGIISDEIAQRFAVSEETEILLLVVEILNNDPKALERTLIFLKEMHSCNTWEKIGPVCNACIAMFSFSDFQDEKSTSALVLRKMLRRVSTLRATDLNIESFFTFFKAFRATFNEKASRLYYSALSHFVGVICLELNENNFATHPRAWEIISFTYKTLLEFTEEKLIFPHIHRLATYVGVFSKKIFLEADVDSRIEEYDCLFLYLSKVSVFEKQELYCFSTERFEELIPVFYKSKKFEMIFCEYFRALLKLSEITDSKRDFFWPSLNGLWKRLTVVETKTGLVLKKHYLTPREQFNLKYIIVSKMLSYTSERIRLSNNLFVDWIDSKIKELTQFQVEKSTDSISKSDKEKMLGELLQLRKKVQKLQATASLEKIFDKNSK